MNTLEELAKLINPQEYNDYPAGEKTTQIGEDDVEKLRGREEIEALRIANKLKCEELECRKQDRAQRKVYADYLFIFLCIYMLIVLSVLYKSGCAQSGFELSDSVVITLITTTTANVIGIFVLVIKYLFKSPEEKR